MNEKEAIEVLVNSGYVVTLEKEEDFNVDHLMSEVDIKFVPKELINIMKLRVNLCKGKYDFFEEFDNYEEMYDSIASGDFDVMNKSIYSSGEGLCVFWRSIN